MEYLVGHLVEALAFYGNTLRFKAASIFQQVYAVRGTAEERPDPASERLVFERNGIQFANGRTANAVGTGIEVNAITAPARAADRLHGTALSTVSA